MAERTSGRVRADGWVIVVIFTLLGIFVVFLTLRLAGVFTGDASYAILRGCGVAAAPVAFIGMRQIAEKKERAKRGE
jgi:hypothetical protein